MTRFTIAQDGPKPTDAQLESQSIIRGQIRTAAVLIERETQPSREQSLALTKLEEALMWAGRAIFTEVPR